MRGSTHPPNFDSYPASSASRPVNVHHSQSFEGLSTQGWSGEPGMNSKTPYCLSRSISFLAVPGCLAWSAAWTSGVLISTRPFAPP